MEFDEAFREQFEALIRWRRDIRHFERRPLPDGWIEELLALACCAPSVGLSQPWRFVRVRDAGRRGRVRAIFEACNREALDAQAPERADLYARLKLAGLDDAPEQIAVFADPDPVQGAGLGRRTMPETVSYSVVTAIHTLWLAARARGVGLGWVSILDPDAVRHALDVPASWPLVGYLCLGYPREDSDTPLLEQIGWERRGEPGRFVLER